jgi:hypothetical protein
MASMAASDASKLAKLMNAKPFEFPVVGSLMICIQKNKIVKFKNPTMISNLPLVSEELRQMLKMCHTKKAIID